MTTGLLDHTLYNMYHCTRGLHCTAYVLQVDALPEVMPIQGSHMN